MHKLAKRTARPRHEGERGFTLIELLVVIAVLAVLAAIVIFNVTGVTNRGSSSACATDLKTVQTASDAYHSDHGSYPAALGDLQPAYLHTTPSGLGTVDFNSDGKGTVTSTSC
jgi:prepilin-type N-terminal cleavage/methylation domain-containing protein